MPAAKTFHVRTFVQYPREKTEDLVAHATLVHARDDKQNIEGDVTEAVFDQTQNYECDGKGPGTGGCQEQHEQAVERVRSRLVGADGDVAVVWRRFHPLVAQANATPGKPFEAEDERGVRVRIEVQEIIPSAEEQNEPMRISTTSLDGMRAELDARRQEAQLKAQLRQAFSMFEDVQLSAADEQLEDYEKRFRFLPDQKKIAAALATAKKALEAIAKGADKQTIAALGQKLVNNKAQQALQAELQKAEQTIRDTFVPLQKIEAGAQELIARQAEVRTELDNIDAIVKGLEKRRDDGLGALDPAALDDGPVRGALHALLEDATAGKIDAAALTKALKPLRADVAKLRQVGEKLVGAQEALQTVFQARVDRVEGWRKGDGAKERLLAYVDFGVAFAGFAAPHWRKQIDALGEKMADLPKVNDLVYDDPKHEARLVAAEKALGPVAVLEAAIDDDMQRRTEGVHQVLLLGDRELQAPSAWVRITAVHPGADRVDVEVHIVNNDVLPLALAVQFGPDDKPDEVLLGGAGRHAKIEYEEVPAKATFTITALGDAGLQAGKRADLMPVLATSETIDLHGDGAVWHVRPIDFNVAEEQPKKAARRLVLEKAEDGVSYDTMKLQGLD